MDSGAFSAFVTAFVQLISAQPASAAMDGGRAGAREGPTKDGPNFVFTIDSERT